MTSTPHRSSVLVIEPWFTGSHRSWAEGFREHSRHDVSLVTLPATQWRWRLRAGAVPLANAVGQHLDQVDRRPDVLLVSGLVDVSSMLGLLRRRLPSTTAVVVYMHESQLVYPTTTGNPDETSVLANWRSWCAADLVLFNSDFHRNAVIDRMPRWLDQRPESDQSATWAEVAERFEVLPVGVADPARPAPFERSDAPMILWPHRWEPDKRPDVFLRAVDKLAATGAEFGLVLAGEDPAGSPERAELIAAHSDHVLAVGPFERTEYRRWLATADLVVSCADHEFFGVAIVEAVLAGCWPLLPDRLSYPELIPATFHPFTLYPSGSFGTALVSAVQKWSAGVRGEHSSLASEMARFTWSSLIDRYDDCLEAIAAATRGSGGDR